MHFYDVLNVESSNSTLVYTTPGTTLLYIAYSYVLAQYTLKFYLLCTVESTVKSCFSTVYCAKTYKYAMYSNVVPDAVYTSVECELSTFNTS